MRDLQDGRAVRPERAVIALVTGAAGGLGRAWVAALRARDATVIAVDRDAAGLAELADDGPGRLEREACDLADPDAIAELAALVARRHPALDLLVNNAGLLEGPPPLDPARLQAVLQVNTVAPLVLSHALADVLAAADAPRIACLCSRIGSLREGASAAPGSYGYAASKAALARCVPILAANLRERGIGVVGLDPGWVATTMAGPATGDRWQLTPEASVRGLLAVIDGLAPADSGCLVRWDGAPCRWYGPPETDAELQRGPQPET